MRVLVGIVKFGFGQHSQANFTWTPINDTCQVMECPALSIPHATVSDSAARTLGQRPNVTCDASFFVSTEADSTDEFFARSEKKSFCNNLSYFSDRIHLND